MSIAIVLAAGASRRFGEADKMLAPVAGRALVLHAVDAVKAAGVARIAAVVSSPEVARILPEDVFALMIAPDQGMSASFHAAIDLALVGHPDWPARAPEADGGKVLLVLGDMPAVSPASLRALLARRDTAAASCQGVRMPPMALAREDLAAARASAQGDRGARAFLAGLAPEALVAITQGEARDVDVQSDLDGL